MEVFVKGKKDKISLNKNHFVSQGGEGSIYARRGVVYKIYTNPKSMIPFAKMQELSSISNINVIKPEKIVLDKRQKPVGYTMRHVSNTYALCQIFLSYVCCFTWPNWSHQARPENKIRSHLTCLWQFCLATNTRT